MMLFVGLILGGLSGVGLVSGSRNTRRPVVVLCLMSIGMCLSFLWPAAAVLLVACSLIPAALLIAPRIVAGSSERKLGPPTHRRAVLLLAAIPLWMGLVDALNGAPPDRLLRYVISAAFLLGFGVLGVTDPVSPADISRIFALSLAISLIVGAVVDLEWIPCRAGKCSVSGELYRGIFPSENTPALFAAVAIAYAWAAGPHRYRRSSMVLLTTVVLATGARTALVALPLAGLAAAAVSIAFVRRNRSRTRYLHKASASAVAVVGAAALWMMITATPEAFSRRGSVWLAARSLGALSDPTGPGLARWQVARDLSAVPDHGAHSQYVHQLLGGGLLALVMYLGALYLLGRRIAGASRGDVRRQLIPLYFMAVVGLTEVVWNPATVDALSLIIVACVVTHPPGLRTGLGSAVAPSPMLHGR